MARDEGQGRRARAPYWVPEPGTEQYRLFAQDQIRRAQKQRQVNQQFARLSGQMRDAIRTMGRDGTPSLPAPSAYDSMISVIADRQLSEPVDVQERQEEPLKRGMQRSGKSLAEVWREGSSFGKAPVLPEDRTRAMRHTRPIVANGPGGEWLQNLPGNISRGFRRIIDTINSDETLYSRNARRLGVAPTPPTQQPAPIARQVTTAVVRRPDTTKVGRRDETDERMERQREITRRNIAAGEAEVERVRRQSSRNAAIHGPSPSSFANMRLGSPIDLPAGQQPIGASGNAQAPSPPQESTRMAAQAQTVPDRRYAYRPTANVFGAGNAPRFAPNGMSLAQLRGQQRWELQREAARQSLGNIGAGSLYNNAVANGVLLQRQIAAYRNAGMTGDALRAAVYDTPGGANYLQNMAMAEDNRRRMWADAQALADQNRALMGIIGRMGVRGASPEDREVQAAASLFGSRPRGMAGLR